MAETRDEHVWWEIDIDLYLMEKADTNAYGGCSVGYATKNDKTGVAHHAMVSVEGEERNNVNNKTDSKTKCYLPKVLF